MLGGLLRRRSKPLTAADELFEVQSAPVRHGSVSSVDTGTSTGSRKKTGLFERLRQKSQQSRKAVR
jgi:hypothetical protein